jgi:hypothetical protein
MREAAGAARLKESTVVYQGHTKRREFKHGGRLLAAREKYALAPINHTVDE